MTASKTPPDPQNPGPTHNRNQEAGVVDSFPASDPPAPTATQGVRAVSPERLARDEAAPPAMPRDAIRVTQDFPDGEAAKLALETLVREGPIDRRLAEIRSEGGRATLAVTLPPDEGKRIEAMLTRLAKPAANPGKV